MAFRHVDNRLYNIAIKSSEIIVLLLAFCNVVHGFVLANDVQESIGVVERFDNTGDSSATNDEINAAEDEFQRQEYIDRIHFEQEINYVALNDDNFAMIRDGSRVIELISEDKFQEAIDILKDNVQRNLERPSWKLESEEFSSEGFMANSGTSLGAYLKLLAVSLELNKQYDDALNVYGVIYRFNPEASFWCGIRIKKRLEEQGNPVYKGRHIPFYNVVDVVQDYHDLSPDNVASVLEKVKQTEEYVKKGEFDRLLGLFQLGIPVYRDSKRRRDLEALELYRLRDSCAQVVCPKLHYIYTSLYHDYSTTVDVTSYSKLYKIRLRNSSNTWNLNIHGTLKTTEATSV